MKRGDIVQVQPNTAMARPLIGVVVSVTDIEVKICMWLHKVSRWATPAMFARSQVSEPAADDKRVAAAAKSVRANNGLVRYGAGMPRWLRVLPA